MFEDKQLQERKRTKFFYKTTMLVIKTTSVMMEVMLISPFVVFFKQ